MYYEFAGFVKPLKGAGVLGGHIIYLSLGNVEGITGEGIKIGEWTPFDMAITISYGLKLYDQLGIGLSGKLIHSFLAPRNIIAEVIGEPGGGSATTFAFDAGVYFTPPLLERFSIAGVIANIGPGLQYISTGQKDPLPHLLRIGVAYRPVWNKFHKITLAADVNKVLVGLINDYRDQGLYYIFREAWKHIGMEYTYYDFLSLRIGRFIDQEGARVGWTFGGGIKFKSFKIDIADDSKIYEFEETGNRRFSITYVMEH